MCGIAGIFGKADATTLSRMLSVLAHRGPDDEFAVCGDGFSLGARRLSIIDIQGGRQPLSNEDGSIWVAQNGEIYNSPDLRKTLLCAGHKFKTRSDTEVIVHLYEDTKDALPNELSGMFAIALWDKYEGRGILVRDRVGKKPIYYTERDGCLYFASEIKALLQTGIERRINYEALHYYLTYKHVPCPLTIFKGIYSLPPASIMAYKDGEVAIVRYWSADFTPTLGYDEDDWTERIIDTLRQSVKARLLSDVPVGFFLSGGLDSSLVVALASEVSKEPIRTFTLAYSENHNGKARDAWCALEVAKQYNTNHQQEVVDIPDFPRHLPQIIMAFDQPFAGVTSTYFLSRYMADYVKVGITGDGADELFGSYLSHRMACDSRIGDEADIRYELGVFSDCEKYRLYSPKMLDYTLPYNTRNYTRAYFDGLTATESLNRMLEAEFKSLFPDQVLTFADRLSMAHSLELRSPYLDTEFVSLAARIPARFKINNGVTKYILKSAASKYLPDSIVNRQKEGFIMPVTEWLHTHLRDYVAQVINVSALQRHGLFDPLYVAGLLDSFHNHTYDYKVGNEILSLLAFQVWYELYMGDAK